MKDKQALTTGDVARYCGVNFRTVIRWIERGHLQAYKLPGRGDNRVPVDAFIEFLQRNHMPVPAALGGTSNSLLLLTQGEEFAADLAAFVRKAGWEAWVTPDPMQFGFLLAREQPAALMLTHDAARESVDRLLREQDAGAMLRLVVNPLAVAPEDGGAWRYCQWPGDQQALLALLSPAG